MKRHTLISSASAAAVLILLLSASCAKETGMRREDTEYARLTFTTGVTKNANAVMVSDIRTLDVLVFDVTTGALESSGHSDMECTVSVDVPLGRDLDWRVVANASEGAFSGVSALKDFNALVSPLEESLNGIVMAAGGHDVFRSGKTVDVTLTRLMAKVDLEDVRFEFLDGMTDTDLRITELFLLNVPGEVSYTAKPVLSPSVWYNRLVHETVTGTAAALLYNAENIAVTGPEPVVVNESIPCCPNGIDNGVDSSTQPEWSPRNTRLVLTVEVGGGSTVWYYSVTMPAMECGKCYRVKHLVFKGPGAPMPDVQPGRMPVTFSVEITPWGDNDVEADFR